MKAQTEVQTIEGGGHEAKNKDALQKLEKAKVPGPASLPPIRALKRYSALLAAFRLLTPRAIT